MREPQGVEMAANVAPGVRAEQAEEPGRAPGQARSRAVIERVRGVGRWRLLVSEAHSLVSIRCMIDVLIGIVDASDHTVPAVAGIAEWAAIGSRTRSTRPSWSRVSAAIQPDIRTIGMPGPGMGGAAGQVEPGDVGAAVGRLERPGESPVTGQAVDGAVEHAVAVVDVLRGQPALDLIRLLDVVEPRGGLELLEDRLAVAGIEGLPVVMGPQVGRVHQDVEGLAAGRGDLRLGGGRGTDVAGRVGRRLALAVDDVELLVRIAREDEVVMEQVVVTAVEAQVEDHARAGRLVAAGASRTGRPPACRPAARDGSARSRSWRRRPPAAPGVPSSSSNSGDRAVGPGEDRLDAALGNGARRRARRPAGPGPRRRRGCRRADTRRPRPSACGRCRRARPATGRARSRRTG